MLKNGLIIKINSDTFTVKVDNQIYDCKSRGKFRELKLKPLVGDHVKVDIDKKVIEEILERQNYLERPAVSNIEMALIVTSLKSPDLDLLLLDKLISIMIINKIEPVIIFTKLDLLEEKEISNFQNLKAYYQKIGLQVFSNQDIIPLKEYLKNHVVTVCGQTGAGKSTLINRLCPNLNLATNEISQSLGRGKHTTRVVELFQVDDFYIVDTPGFSKIFIHNYPWEQIKMSFIEFPNNECQFKDCKHDKENGCQVKEEVSKGHILQSRYTNYLKFIKES